MTTKHPDLSTAEAVLAFFDLAPDRDIGFDATPEQHEIAAFIAECVRLRQMAAEYQDIQVMLHKETASPTYARILENERLREAFDAVTQSGEHDAPNWSRGFVEYLRYAIKGK